MLLLHYIMLDKSVSMKGIITVTGIILMVESSNCFDLLQRVVSFFAMVEGKNGKRDYLFNQWFARTVGVMVKMCLRV